MIIQAKGLDENEVSTDYKEIIEALKEENNKLK
jgi:dihydroxyacetone kinase DhaKLM complex PTS-EIIA-like component DhaM